MLDQEVNLGRRLAWRKLEVFYSHDDIGQTWERHFADKVAESMRDLATLLTSPGYRRSVPDLGEVSFHQLRSPTYFGGSMFKLHGAGSGNDEDFSVIYATFYTPAADPDAKTSFTIRVPDDARAERDRLLHRRFCTSYVHVKANSEAPTQLIMFRFRV